MTQTIDPTRANVDELRRWFADEPCPTCNGSRWNFGGDDFMERRHEECTACLDTDGRPTGLAFPWASELCRPCYVCLEHGRKAIVDEDGCCVTCGADAPECDGGRVPKAVGLEVLFEHGLMSVADHSDNGYFAVYGVKTEGTSMKIAVFNGKGETPLLAALRAGVRSLRS